MSTQPSPPVETKKAKTGKKGLPSMFDEVVPISEMQFQTGKPPRQQAIKGLKKQQSMRMQPIVKTLSFGSVKNDNQINSPLVCNDMV